MLFVLCWLNPLGLQKFWVEALSTAVYMINHLPTPILNYDSPYFRLFAVTPEYQSLHTFGCVCFAHLLPPERHKLVAQSVKCAFMRYSNTQKGFVCYDATAKKFKVSCNVVFFENQYFFFRLILFLILLLLYFLCLMMSLLLLCVSSQVMCITVLFTFYNAPS